MGDTCIPQSAFLEVSASKLLVQTGCVIKLGKILITDFS
jgi:hypothetical protein